MGNPLIVRTAGGSDWRPLEEYLPIISYTHVERVSDGPFPTTPPNALSNLEGVIQRCVLQALSYDATSGLMKRLYRVLRHEIASGGLDAFWRCLVRHIRTDELSS